MAVQFDNFSAQAFEQLIQALASRILGKGVNIYGAGPDGAREATFEGEVPYPSAAQHWDGYIVLQAKCRARLRYDTSDANWVAAQLEKDLVKFTDEERGLRKPEYYILCTNATLSGVAETGGKAKVDAVFEKHRKELGLRDWRIWAADELATFLDDAADIRTAYTAWLTPSDVIAALVSSLERPNLTELIPLALSRDIKADRYVKLGDAGDDSETPVALHDAFIDLPIPETPRVGALMDPEPDDETDAQHEQFPPTKRGIVARLLRRAADRFTDVAAAERLPAGGLANRIVILGGPGQGKSTLGQFLAQVCRARLLRGHKNISAEAKALIAPTLERARIELLPTNGPGRFPIRIELPRYADLLQKARTADRSLTLLSFFAARLSEDVAVDIAAHDLRAWLGTCPSLLIIDGLDEVPPTGNRRDVIAQIDALWDDLHHVCADALIIVTTRRQGYNGDLSPDFWQHWELSPLSRQEALRCATRLADIHLSEKDRRTALLAELVTKSEDSTTRHLMISPLQVTIIFGIAALAGSIPRDRWHLFHRYYTLLRDRESRKQGWIGQIISDYGNHIDALHHEAGFLLQVAAESAGSARPYLTPDHFRALAERLLRDEGYNEAEVHSIARSLVQIATDRLVLLSARVEGRIEFDVRSLQESMAAMQLMSGDFMVITNRLRRIAPSAHWRHVFRIAASKIFAERGLQNLRNQVLSICDALDCGDDDPDSRTTRAGAKLALDLILDGVAAGAPKSERALALRAIGLLDLGSGPFNDQLWQVCSPRTEELVYDEVFARLQQHNTPAAFAAWKFAFELLISNAERAEHMIIQNWPSDDDLALKIIERSPPAFSTPGVRSCLADAQWRAGPEKVLALRQTLEFVGSSVQNGFNPTIIPLSAIPAFGNDEFAPLSDITVLRGERLDALSISVSPVKNPSQTAMPDPPAHLGDQTHPGWEALSACVKFGRDPSQELLAQCILLVGSSARRLIRDIDSLPWVLMMALQDVADGAAPTVLAAAVRAGELGDVKDWTAAEHRWRRHGICPEDVAAWAGDRYVSERIADVGAPIPASWSVTGMAARDREQVARFVDAIDAVGRPSRQEPYLRMLLALSDAEDESSRVNPLDRLAIRVAALSSAGNPGFATFVLSMLPEMWSYADGVDAADRLGRQTAPQIALHLRRSQDGKCAREAILAFRTDTRLRGVLPFIAAYTGMLDLNTLVETDVICELPGEAFEWHQHDSDIIRSAVSWLRLRMARWTAKDVPELVQTLFGSNSILPRGRLEDVFLESAVMAHPERHILMAETTRYITTTDSAYQAAFVAYLAAVVSARPSGLTDEVVRRELELPIELYDVE